MPGTAWFENWGVRERFQMLAHSNLHFIKHLNDWQLNVLSGTQETGDIYEWPLKRSKELLIAAIFEH